MADRKQMLKEINAIGSSVELLLNEPLKAYSTFRIGGPAKVLLVPDNLASLKDILNITRSQKKYIIGNGSKILFPDSGIDGIVLRISGGMDDLLVNGRAIIVGAGTKMQSLIMKTCALGLSGLEFAAGVPAALGGAVVMNLGAKGRQMSDIIEWVEVMGSDGKCYKLDKGDLDFGYRKSGIKNAIVTSLKLRLSYDKRINIEKKIKENLEWRKKTQPYGKANAGSIFKNPHSASAGKLIDLAGMKGAKVGGAQVSRLHANFIVNNGGAKASDVIKLITKIKAEVLKRYRNKLELELVDSGRMNMIF